MAKQKGRCCADLRENRLVGSPMAMAIYFRASIIPKEILADLE